MENSARNKLKTARKLIIIGCTILAIGVLCSQLIEGMLNTGRINIRPLAGIIVSVLGILIGIVLMVIGKVIDLAGMRQASNEHKDMGKAFALGILSVLLIIAMLAAQLLRAPYLVGALGRVAVFLIEIGIIIFAIRAITGEKTKKSLTALFLIGIASAALSVATTRMRNAAVLQTAAALLPMVLLIIASVIYLNVLRGSKEAEQETPAATETAEQTTEYDE